MSLLLETRYHFANALYCVRQANSAVEVASTASATPSPAAAQAPDALRRTQSTTALPSVSIVNSKEMHITALRHSSSSSGVAGHAGQVEKTRSAFEAPLNSYYAVLAQEKAMGKDGWSVSRTRGVSAIYDFQSLRSRFMQPTAMLLESILDCNCAVSPSLHGKFGDLLACPARLFPTCSNNFYLSSRGCTNTQCK